jgi:hypothetical protein
VKLSGEIMVKINLKIVKEKLSVFRHNLSLLVPIIIAIVAVILFIPTRLISSKLREQIAKESIGKARRLKSMDVVSSDRWKQEQQYQQAYENDANQIEKIMLQSTKRELLSYKIFPKPKSTSVLVFEEFGQHYRKGLTEMIDELNVTESPTETEIQRTLEQMTSTRSSRIVDRGRFPATSSTPARTSLYGLYGGGRGRSEAEEKIVDEICRGKAKLGSIYANVSDLAGYDFWGEYKYDAGIDQSTEDCWYWQLGYWVIEDIIDTIEKLNSGSNSVLTSPIKRLMSVKFTLGHTNVRTSRGGRRGSMKKKDTGEKPTYVVSQENGLTIPCTERVCDDNIDVIHFNVTVLLASKDVLPFMQELCGAKEHKFRGYLEQKAEETFKHNQITILESNINPVDHESIFHELYRYGEDAVVELDLICEYIFIKESYEKIKPEAVKETLKGEDED